MIRSLLGILASALHSVRKPAIRKLEREYLERQWWSTEALLRFDESRTRDLLIHAGKHAPYYRDLFRSIGVDPATMTFPADWGKIPLLDKEILREKHDSLAAEGDRDWKANTSGGSTGIPVRFRTDQGTYEMMEACFRMMISWAGWKRGEMVMMLWGGTEAKNAPKVPEWRKVILSRNLKFYAHSFGEAEFEVWAATIRRYRPTILYSYPSVAAAFAGWLKERRIGLPGLKGVFCSAEALLPHHRKQIEDAFQCKVHNQYGSREAPCVGCECPEGNMHILVDSNRVEFIDEEGSGGGGKRIVVTPLSAYAQPLVRYDLGDLGSPRAGTCRCGRGYPLMEMNVGRSNDHFIAGGKRIYLPLSHLVDLFGDFRWIRNYQFVQVEEDRIELAVETFPVDDLPAKMEELRGSLAPAMSGIMGIPVRLVVRPVDAIEKTSSGKHRFVISKMSKSLVKS